MTTASYTSRWRTQLLLLALASAACAKAPAPKDEPVKGGCDTLFAAPPASEKLCEKHVAANDSEIAWSSYALADALPQVTQRYRDAAGRCSEAKTSSEPWTSIAVGERSVSMHDATAAGYPSCEKKPSSSHKTVVIVSRRTLRGP